MDPNKTSENLTNSSKRNNELNTTDIVDIYPISELMTIACANEKTTIQTSPKIRTFFCPVQLADTACVCESAATKNEFVKVTKGILFFIEASVSLIHSDTTVRF